MKITIELTGIELDALQRALTEKHGEDEGKTPAEFVKDCVLEQFYCRAAAYRAAVTHDPDFDSDMKVAKAIMKKRRGMLRKLAKP
jgi:hypothetical protein